MELISYVIAFDGVGTEVLFLIFLQIFYIPTLYWLILFIKKRWLRVLAIVGWLVYIIIHVVSILYYINRRISFDFGFFYYNRKVALKTVLIILKGSDPKYMLLFLLALFTYFTASAYKSRLSNKTIKIVMLLITFLSIGSNLIFNKNNTIFRFVQFNTYRKSELKNTYDAGYRDFLDLKIRRKLTLEKKSDFVGKNLLIIKLESLNSVYVINKLTPHMIKAADKGFLFENVYSPSVQTIRSNEVLLCGVPPSIGDTLVYSLSKEEIENLECLPSLFNKLGYRTHYFGTGPKNFDNQENFASYMGFEELHSQDIVGDDIKKVGWGYREDVYLKKVSEYLGNSTDEKPFLGFVNLGSTNHYPFYPLVDVSSELEAKLPFKNPQSYYEKIGNTTFLQDYYIKDFLDYYFENLHKNTYLLLIGDHPYPSGLHKNNTYNEKGAFEENFLTSMVLIPPLKDPPLPDQPNNIETRYSHADVYVTFLSLLGVDKNYLEGSLGKTIKEVLPEDSSNTSDNMIVSVQPFGGGHIALYKLPNKLLISLFNDKAELYDVIADPNESSPMPVKMDIAKKYIEDYFSLGFIQE